jgi:hypothetical protein
MIKRWREGPAIKAAHFFAYMHGQEVMNAIFGPTVSQELFSLCDEMIVSAAVKV